MAHRPRRRTAHTGPPPLSRTRLDQLVEEATIDANGDSEQLVGFLCMLQEHLAVPFTTPLLGIPVQVERIDMHDADEIVAICRRGSQRQRLPIVDLPLPSPPPDGWEWIAAYRHWARHRR